MAYSTRGAIPFILLSKKSTDSVTRAAYLAISRARDRAAIHTDSRAKLTEALGLRDGAQVGAIDATMVREREKVGLSTSREGSIFEI